ncbi:MAG TPA: HAD family hydrolase [Lapillicoccus sp.]|nr:HAD family hydrolase [Lapillicoccus sp.]
MPSMPPAPPIRGVVFDFHHTLAHAGDPEVWVREAWTNLGREGDPQTALGDDYGSALAFLDQLWEEARVIDPDNERDHGPEKHREVFDQLIAAAPGIDLELADALYQIMHRQWDVYDDVIPVLTALRDKGVRVAMLSNVGFDLSPTLARTGVDELLDGVVMSYAVGAVKPEPAIFQNALDTLGLPASEVLMVGDAWQDDAAAAALGMRTLILPRTDDPSHGLELVVRLV